MKDEKRAGRDFDNQWRERFVRFAEDNDDDAGIAGWSQSGLDIRFRRFRALCRFNGTHDCWIDAGCGAGTYSRFLAEQGKKVVALDYSLTSVDKARKRSCSNSILWLVCTIQAIPLQDIGFNGCLCFGVTQAVSDQKRLLAELHRVLAVEGILWIDGLNIFCLPHLYDFLIRSFQNKPAHEHFQSPWKLRNAMKNIGFRYIELIWIPILPKRYQRFQPWLESRFVTRVVDKFPILGALFCHTFFLVGTKGDL